MEVSTKAKVVILGAVAVGSFYLGWTYAPTKTEIKTVEVEKEVIKHIKDVIVTRETTTKPDGTVIEREVTEDRSVTESKKDSFVDSSTVIKKGLPQWRIWGTVGQDLAFKEARSYGLGVEKRLLGPIFVGVWGNTSQEVGLSVSMEF